MEEHEMRVRAIAAQVRSFHDRNERYRIYHGSTSTTRRTKLSRNRVVDTRDMNHVLQVDTQKCVALVEPNVSMEQLVDATLAHGLVAPVVMEFPSITVGGGFAGTSGESSSFRHGLFENTINKIEIVLADGEVVYAFESERADLFKGAAGSFGTFGVITLLEIRLIPAKRFVKVTYHPVSSVDEAVHRIEKLTADPETDYLEGIMFRLEEGVVMSGKSTDGVDAEDEDVIRFTRARDPWFYMHAEKMMKKASFDEEREIVPIKDYLFRYDRGAFWSGMYSFKYFFVPFNWVTRWALDSLLRTRTMYHALHKSGLAEQYIVQDIGFPYATVVEFVEYVDRTFGFYPLWLCPLKVEREMPLRPRSASAYSSEARSPGMMLNIGLWGPGPAQYDRFIGANREIERKTAELGGLKCFYAQAFYTEEEFWSVYDKPSYDALREKYKATGLPSVCDKVNVDLSVWTPARDMSWKQWLYQKFKEQWPVKGVYGVLQVFVGREYLLG